MTSSFDAANDVTSVAVRMGRTLVAATVLVAACSAGPKTYHPADVTSISFQFVSPAEGTIARPHVTAHDSVFSHSISLLPDPLPQPRRTTTTCAAATLTLGMRDGSTLTYGPCDNFPWVAALFQVTQSNL
jgi:hypothetical protein